MLSRSCAIRRECFRAVEHGRRTLGERPRPATNRSAWPRPRGSQT
jgi:hypothetical protein